jgi:hypothetical protein
MELDDTVGSRSKKSKSKSKSFNLDEDNSMMSQLDAIVNKKKLNKKSDELSIARTIDEIVEKKITEPSSKRSSFRKKSSSINSLDSLDKNKEKAKKTEKENRNESVRREKAQYLYLISKLVESSKGKHSSKMNMDYLLDDIKNEYLRIKSSNDNEFAVDWLKKGIVLAAKGIEFGNNMFDPLGVDLNGWGDQMQYEKDNYNDVLSELYEKYKGGGAMSPEIKLLFMFGGSALTYVASNKLMNDPSAFANFMPPGLADTFFKNVGENVKRQPQQQQFQQPQQQQFQQQQFQQQQFQQPQQQQQFQQQQFQQQQFQQPQQQQQFQQPQQQQFQQFQQPQFQQRMPMPGIHQGKGVSLSELRNQIQKEESENSDKIPSKIKIPDTANIENIMKKMDAHAQQNNESEEDSVLKEIIPKKRGVKQTKKAGIKKQISKAVI